MFDTLQVREVHDDPIDPATYSVERLEAEMRQLAADLAAGEARFLQLVAEFDRRRLWVEWSMRSPAEWVAWKCGLSPGAARERVRVARCLQDLPLTRTAFERGELSYSKVRALTRVVDAETEEALVNFAANVTASQLDRTVAALVKVQERDDLATANERHEARFVRSRYDDNGDLVGSFRLPADVGPQLMATMNEFTERPPTRDEQAAGAPWTTIEQRRADALAAMATAAAGQVPKSAADRTMVHVEVAADVLTNDADGVSRVRNGPTLAAETVRRLCCDATLVFVATNDDCDQPIGQAPEAAAVSKPVSSIPRATRRALARRDGGRCRFPGCETTLGCEAHHIVHRAKGGSHMLENLITLCRRHHHAVHEGGFGLALEDGHVVFRRPDGRTLDIGPSITGCRERLAAGNTATGIEITPATLRPGGNERLNMSYATSVLCDQMAWFRRRDAVDVPAGTSTESHPSATATGPPPPI